MLRAKIADQTVALFGCDSMAHAEKFAAFPTGETAADFCMTVAYTDAVLPPQGDIFGHNATARWIQQKNGQFALYHNKGGYLLQFDKAFSDVSFTLKTGLPKADILHYLYVSQSFSYHLLSKGGCTLHSAGMRIGGSGVALCGKSGVGKSTLARHLTALDDKASIVSEDSPALTPTASDRWLLHGTPFCGGDEQFENATVPLCCVVLLRKSDRNAITVPADSQALFGLLPNMPRPVYCRPLHERAVDIARQMLQQVPIVQFEHDGTPNAAAFLCEMLSGKGWI